MRRAADAAFARALPAYNHLGNNDGKNLDASRGGELQFRSKEISKSSVVDDMVAANSLLYKPVLNSPKGEKEIEKGDKARQTEHPDHCVSG